jgi:hypothetical protein
MKPEIEAEKCKCHPLPLLFLASVNWSLPDIIFLVRVTECRRGVSLFLLLLQIYPLVRLKLS